MGSKRYRPVIPEDTACWWCGAAVLSAHGDCKHAVFCSLECENKWYQAINSTDRKFQEWDD